MTPALALSDVDFVWRGPTGFRLTVPAFDVCTGERVLLLGNSGSGKSTLLGLICGIHNPRTGTIRVAGRDITHLRGAARDRFRGETIGIIFQQFNLLPYATALDNILLPLQFAPKRRARLADPRQAALSMTDSLGLPREKVQGSPANTLSVGQQQRVAVARALIGAPPLIIADEPTSALDSDTQDSFLKLLFAQCAAAGSSLLMVSHDQRLGGRFDRTVRMEDITRRAPAAAA